uniref:Uncharacterized protein n=1 Tax=Romanomermis culicivorax TaxID=13658 RepID=A0A915IJH6_ROMCU
MIQTARLKERVMIIRFGKQHEPPLKMRSPKSHEFITNVKLGPCEITELPLPSTSQEDQSTLDSPPNLSPRCVEKTMNLSPKVSVDVSTCCNVQSELEISQSSTNIENEKIGDIAKRNDYITKLEIENRKLEKQSADIKWLLSQMTKNFEDYKKQAQTEKNELEEEIERLERRLKEAGNLSFVVKNTTDPESDIIYARPYGSSSRFKPYLHVPRPMAESPCRRSVQYRTNTLRKCLNWICGDKNEEEKIHQIMSFLNSDKQILERVKLELSCKSSECAQFRLTPSETYNFMKTFNLSMYQMKFMKRYFLKAKGLLLFCSDLKLQKEVSGQNQGDENDTDE